eukprot:COSAG01_NODE_5661_length_4108_cov_3.674390_1_plen_54_part_00
MLPLEHEGLRLMSFGWLRTKEGRPVWGPEAELDTRGAGEPSELAVSSLSPSAP